MQDITTMTIRDIALQAPLTTRVFESFKIDFCCGGRVPFREACENAGVDSSEVFLALQKVFDADEAAASNTVEREGQAELVRHIVDTHHVYTREELTRLLPLAEKVFNRHGDGHPELANVLASFKELADDLFIHMKKEEMVLFPYIEQLARAVETDSMPPAPHFGTVNNPVRMMMFEHDRAGELLKELRTFSSDYAAPEGACPSYKGLYAGLEALEKDLHQHIHLENNVLFPKAIADEEECIRKLTVAAG